MTFNFKRVLLYSLLCGCLWLALLTLFNILASSGAFAHTFIDAWAG